MQAKLKNFKKNLLYYEAAMKQLKTYLEILNTEISFLDIDNPINHVSTRIKSTESIILKLQRKNLPLTIESLNSLNDIVGARIVCDFLDNVYLVSDKLKNNKNIKIIEVKDYIKNPKENGYRSLHLIVAVPIFLQNEKREMKVEVQLRTIAMDFWASLEHKLRYKKDIPADKAKYLEDEMLACAQISADLDMRMQNVRDVIAENTTPDEQPLLLKELS